MPLVITNFTSECSDNVLHTTDSIDTYLDTLGISSYVNSVYRMLEILAFLIYFILHQLVIFLCYMVQRLM